MDIEFHFYMTHLIALRAGFSSADAFKIAYASQYTDDNENVFMIEGNNEPYVNLISQTMDITKPQEERLSIYPAFHFCPAPLDEIFKTAPLRRDGAYHRLDTLPDNSNARTIFSKAMATGNLYRIGIGAHMYADTFCHRDFVGWKDAFNWITLDGFVEGIWSAMGPAIGHALAMHSPDIPALVWEDARLTSKYKEKDNKEQILAAAGRIFDFFVSFRHLSDAETIKKTLIGDLAAAIGEETESDSDEKVKARKVNYETLLGANYQEYRKAAWFTEAIQWNVDPHTVGTSNMKYEYTWKNDYISSDWFKFQEAVKVHHAVAFQVLGPTFEAMGIDAANT